MSAQPNLFDAPTALAPNLPEGLVYQPDFITPAEEAGLIARFADLPFEAFQFRGHAGRRRVVYFGWRYDVAAGVLGQAGDIPDFLHPLRDRCAALAGLAPAAFGHVLINQYAPGAPIGWHRDRPLFDKVAGVSLGSAGLFRFRRARGEGWERAALRLAPRSAYLLDGPARRDWEHSLPPAPALRYSVTFRSLTTAAGTVSGPGGT